jgi:cytochrome oxidase assembly protein ShyY1
MGRDEAPADVQWARALTAVAIALALASWQLCRLHFCLGVN